MKNIFRNIFALFIALLILAACQNVKDGLSGKKKSNTDEFLVKKKQPLVLPPEFEKLPQPERLKKDIKISEDEDDLKKILTKNKNKTKIDTVPTNKNSNDTLKSVMEKIKNN